MTEVKEGGVRTLGYERRIVIRGQGLTRTWHVPTPERHLLDCKGVGKNVCTGAGECVVIRKAQLKLPQDTQII